MYNNGNGVNGNNNYRPQVNMNQQVNQYNQNNYPMTNPHINNDNNNNVIENNKRLNFKIDINVVLVILILIALLFVGGIYNNYFMNKSRTIMIYMVGSNLETGKGIATNDLDGIAYKGPKDEKIRVLLMAGGTKSWSNSYVSASETSIYELTDNGFVKVDKRSINNMGSIDNLSYFLNYSYEHYDSDLYDLIFWNHGGAVDGSEYDELMGQDNLKLTEMRMAFEKSPFKAKNKLETIFFRTCLNGTIEVANLLSDYADYLIASEEVTVGSKYTISALEFINALLATDSAVEYGRKVIDTYEAMILNICNQQAPSSEDENYCVDLTYSLIDLSKIAKVNEKMDEVFADVSENLGSNYSDIVRIRANSKQYGSDELLYDMIDLYDFSSKLKPYSDKVNGLLKAIDKAVVYDITNNDYSHGLSIYHPFNGTNFWKTYSDISVAKNYTNYLTNFLNLKQGVSNVNIFSNLSNNDISLRKESKDEADFTLTLTDEQAKNFARAVYYVFADTEDGYYKMLYTGSDVELDGNVLKAKVEGKHLKVGNKNFEDDEFWLTVVEDKVTDDYVDVVTSALLTRGLAKSTIVNIKIRIDDEHPNGQIISIIEANSGKNNNGNKLSYFSNEAISLDNYDYIEFVGSHWDLFDDQGNFTIRTNTNNPIYGVKYTMDEFQFLKYDFDDDVKYYAVFEVFDSANKSFFSKVISLEK